MRILRLLLGELRFLLRYGIVFLYIGFTLVYLCVLSIIPSEYRDETAIIMIFTDPAAMGLFFMGAIMLLEKSQRIESSISVSPVKISSYIFAKVIAIMFISILVALILGIYANLDLPLLLLGVAGASIMFSLCGIIIGANTKSLNSFMILSIPFEIILFGPPILFYFDVLNSPLWLMHPGVSAICLIDSQTSYVILALLVIAIWINIFFYFARKAVKKSFITMGGADI